jgi:hypothetical protein
MTHQDRDTPEFFTMSVIVILLARIHLFPQVLHKLSHCRSLAGLDGKIRYNQPLK